MSVRMASHKSQSASDCIIYASGSLQDSTVASVLSVGAPLVRAHPMYDSDGGSMTDGSVFIPNQELLLFLFFLLPCAVCLLSKLRVWQICPHQILSAILCWCVLQVLHR